jgi:hypothetical protein
MGSMKTDHVKIPALRKGNGFLGVEHFGCMNSGRRAAIYRAKFADVFIVGYQSDVQRAVNRTASVDQVLKGKRVIRWTEPGGGKRNGSKYVVYAFKGRTAAVAKFHELNDAVLTWNASERARVAAHRRAVRLGDMDEALRTAD